VNVGRAVLDIPEPPAATPSTDAQSQQHDSWCLTRGLGIEYSYLQVLTRKLTGPGSGGLLMQVNTACRPICQGEATLPPSRTHKYLHSRSLGRLLLLSLGKRVGRHAFCHVQQRLSRRRGTRRKYIRPARAPQRKACGIARRRVLSGGGTSRGWRVPVKPRERGGEQVALGWLSRPGATRRIAGGALA
jgi:hypothetical protein